MSIKIEDNKNIGKKKAMKIEDNKVMLPDGEVVKLRKRYCDKRKDEKYITKRLKEINTEKAVGNKKTKIKDKGVKIPIRLDEKTIAYVWEYLCIGNSKWYGLLGGLKEMEAYISKIKNNELKIWQI